MFPILYSPKCVADPSSHLNILKANAIIVFSFYGELCSQFGLPVELLFYCHTFSPYSLWIHFYRDLSVSVPSLGKLTPTRLLAVGIAQKRSLQKLKLSWPATVLNRIGNRVFPVWSSSEDERFYTDRRTSELIDRVDILVIRMRLPIKWLLTCIWRSSRHRHGAPTVSLFERWWKPLSKLTEKIY